MTLKKQPPDVREALAVVIAEGLTGTLHCSRAWSAWSNGTMSQDDFEPVEDSTTPGEVADAILAHFVVAHPTAEPERVPEDSPMVRDMAALIESHMGAGVTSIESLARDLATLASAKYGARGAIQAKADEPAQQAEADDSAALLDWIDSTSVPRGVGWHVAVGINGLPIFRTKSFPTCDIPTGIRQAIRAVRKPKEPQS